MNVEVTNLKKHYTLLGQEIPVLHGLNLRIVSGEMISLTGPSGVGKSTLLHLLGTLDVPSSGSITFGGVDAFAKTPAEIAHFRNANLGFVFQFHHLLPEFTALENAMMPCLISRSGAASAEKRASELLARVGLANRMQHKPGELSGGEQQRVALARALVNEPKLLLADEPTGNLDEDTGAQMMELMNALNRERNITVLVVTHNRRLAAQAKRQLMLTQAGISE